MGYFFKFWLNYKVFCRDLLAEESMDRRAGLISSALYTDSVLAL
jgi:hypothetical protein